MHVQLQVHVPRACACEIGVFKAVCTSVQVHATRYTGLDAAFFSLSVSLLALQANTRAPGPNGCTVGRGVGVGAVSRGVQSSTVSCVLCGGRCAYGFMRYLYSYVPCASRRRARAPVGLRAVRYTGHSGVRSFAHLAHRSLYHIGIPGCSLALLRLFFSCHAIHAMWCEVPFVASVASVMKELTLLQSKLSCASSRRDRDDRRHKAATTFKPPPSARRSSPRAGRGRPHALDATRALHNRS